MFVEGGGGLCHGTMAQWPAQACGGSSSSSSSSSSGGGTFCHYYARPHRAEALSDDARLTSVCLSRTAGLNREQRGLGRLKLAQRQPTSHVRLGHHFQGQKVKGQLAGAGHIVAASRTARCLTSLFSGAHSTSCLVPWKFSREESFPFASATFLHARCPPII